MVKKYCTSLLYSRWEVMISDTSRDVIGDITSVYRIVDQVKGKRYNLTIGIQWTGMSIQAL